MASSTSFSRFFISFFFAVVVLVFLVHVSFLTSTASGDEYQYQHLHLHLHERNLGAPNGTMVYAVELRREAPYGNGFGNIIVFDNVLRETAEPASPAIGMEQGFGVGSSLAQNSGLTMLELVFTAGRYGRSSLSVFGTLRSTEGASERAIVGGSGEFRLARGYVLSRVGGGTNETLIWELDAYILRHHN
ncbi:pterocarpan synthase 1-like [Zingiber officinale]|uniref:pterocarpan synthase 1-like n=1 Tax=Zingiber officinale TaxID=94328 RepID=UPI001C4C1136|nr:pterocarpan synthase 1-like [Zingiber officinale]